MFSARVERRLVGSILLAALLMRLLYLFEYRARSIFYGRLMLDAQVYDLWARRIASGEWLAGPAFYHAPLYPYLLAFFFKILGHHYLPVYLFQIGLGIGVLYLVIRIGRQCASAGAGILAGALLALYAPLPFFETKLMSTSLGVALSVASLALLAAAWRKGGAPRWLCAGVSVGLAALAHPASLLLAPVFAGALLFRAGGLRPAGALAAGTILALAPATLHNFRSGGGFLLISSQGGITFLQGNLPASRGLYRPVEGFTGSPLSQEAEEKAIAEKAAGRPLKASEVSGYWFRQGLDVIRDHPGEFLGLLQLKMLRWLSSYEYSTEYSLALERRQVPVLWLFFVPFGFLAAGAAAGAWMARREIARLAPVTLYLLATAAPPLLFYVSSRYRIAVVPALAILAGVAAERIGARLRQGALLDALPAALAVAVAGAFTLIPYGRDHLFQEANVHYNQGNLYYDLGDYDRAIDEYRQALAVSDFEFYRINLGNALTRKGRFEEAIDQYRQVTLRKPRFAKAHIQWAKTLAEQGRMEEALEQYRKALALGTASPDLEAKLRLAGVSQGAGDIDAARRAVAAEPGSASLRNTLGIALQKQGGFDEAEREYRAAAALDPSYEKPHFNLGLLLEARGKKEEALGEFETAARLNPGYARAHVKAGELLRARGDRQAARRHLDAALAAEPGNADAAALKRRLEEGP
jgi:tetratricopeptide (TPR) repeat protein